MTRQKTGAKRRQHTIALDEVDVAALDASAAELNAARHHPWDPMFTRWDVLRHVLRAHTQKVSAELAKVAKVKGRKRGELFAAGMLGGGK